MGFGVGGGVWGSGCRTLAVGFAGGDSKIKFVQPPKPMHRTKRQRRRKTKSAETQITAEYSLSHEVFARFRRTHRELG